MSENEFDFSGSHVYIIVKEAAGRWSWAYTVDSGEPVRMTGPACWSEHHALEDAGVDARNKIRTLREPLWSAQKRPPAPVPHG